VKENRNKLAIDNLSKENMRIAIRRNEDIKVFGLPNKMARKRKETEV